jgi:hypothetical protein
MVTAAAAKTLRGRGGVFKLGVMTYPTFVLRAALASLLLVLVSCGSRESSRDSAGDSGATAEASGESGEDEASGGAASAVSFEGLAIKPVPEGSKLQLKFTATLAAERNQVDADPLGPRSNFKVSRRVELGCRMVAGTYRGLGPDGPTPEQKAIFDAMQAQADQAAGDFVSPDMSALEARVAACGEDQGCAMQAALEAANDPQMRAAAEAAETRNAALSASLEEAANRATAAQREPNWQLLIPDMPPGGGGPSPCEGTITVDDKEVYRLGFDGGDMGEGVETRKGSTPLADGAPFYVWYDLKRGGLIVDVQLNGIRGEVASVNVGGRKLSRNAGFGLNEDWARSAGENTRFRQDSGVTGLPGQWTFSLPITPAVHQGFGGKIDATIGIAPR